MDSVTHEDGCAYVGEEAEWVPCRVCGARWCPICIDRFPWECEQCEKQRRSEETEGVEIMSDQNEITTSVINAIEIGLEGICGDDQDEVTIMQALVIGYLTSHAGSLAAVMCLTTPTHRWMQEFVELDLHTFYIEQKQLQVDDQEHACHLCARVAAPMVLALFREFGLGDSDKEKVEGFLAPMMKATEFILGGF